MNVMESNVELDYVEICPDSCSSNEICSENVCICDVATGFCGGDCPNSCSSTEICLGNTCTCDTTNECVGRKCGLGICGNPCTDSLFKNCAQCGESECTACFGGYFLKDGECFVSIEIKNNVASEGGDYDNFDVQKRLWERCCVFFGKC